MYDVIASHRTYRYKVLTKNFWTLFLHATNDQFFTSRGDYKNMLFIGLYHVYTFLNLVTLWDKLGQRYILLIYFYFLDLPYVHACLLKTGFPSFAFHLWLWQSKCMGTSMMSFLYLNICCTWRYTLETQFYLVSAILFV